MINDKKDYAKTERNISISVFAYKDETTQRKMP